MLFYWSIFIYLLIFSYIEQFSRIKQNIIKIIFLFTILFLFCLSFMRWERGTDWYAYYNLFSDGVQYDRYEWGFRLFNQTIRQYTNNYTVYLFLQSCVYYLVFLLVLNKANRLFSKNPFLNCRFPILLYSFSSGFAGIFMVRSTIAYMICLLSLMYLCEKKSIMYFLCIIVAGSIHHTSYLFLIVYPLFKWSVNKITVFFLVLFAIFTISFSSQMIPLLNAIDMGDYTRYITNDNRESIISIVKWSFVFIALLLLAPLHYLLIYKKILLVFAMGLFMFIWCQFFSTVAQRLAGLFLSTCLPLIMAIVNNSAGKKKFIIITGLALFSIISFWSLLNSQYQDLYIPYKFFWEDFYVITY